MKLILKEYLASLKERNDLDEMLLPNLLSAMGLQVLKTPMIGTRQDGVDISAVGKIKSDKQKYLYLFCIKAGDIGRSDWDSGPQSVRPELQEILDVYIRSKVAAEHQMLPIKICLCLGGVLKETVEQNWAGFTNNRTSKNVFFELWNGDRLAGFMEETFLARELLDEIPRRQFQKALAMVNEPESCYDYTYGFLSNIIPASISSKKEHLLRLRQAYICLHVICAWAIEAKNLEVLYRVSELGLLFCWDTMREQKVHKKIRNHQAKLGIILRQFLILYISMSELYFDKVVYPFADKLHVLSVSVKSRESVDVNLAMFELLGRMACRAIWNDFFQKEFSKSQPNLSKNFHKLTTKMLNTLVAFINNNPTLGSPFKDDHMIEVALVMYLAQKTNSVEHFLPWLREMVENITSAFVSNSFYPTNFNDYNYLLSHPASNDQKYRDSACVGSILYPYLFVWTPSEGKQYHVEKFIDVLNSKIPMCTHQAWFPDEETDKEIWRGGIDHGICVPELSPSKGHKEFADHINEAMEKCDIIPKITALQRGLVPLFLCACRHYRLPIPPSLWFTDNT